jgi:hypothetical protein
MRTPLPRLRLSAFPRLLTATLGLLLAAVLLAAAGHVHHDQRDSTNCALCAIAHVPAIGTAAAPSPPKLEYQAILHTTAPERAPEAPLHAGNSARAPPLA